MAGNRKSKTIRLTKECKLLILTKVLRYIKSNDRTMTNTFLFDTDRPNYRWLFVL